MKKKKLPDSFYNPISLAGTGIAILSFSFIIILILFEAFSGNTSPYLGILTFIVIPAFLIIGLLLIAIGIYREKKREKSAGYKQRELLKIDFSNPKHFRAVLIFCIGTFLLAIFTIFGSFKAYEYTESDEFCGTLCHLVMEPEYTAYKSSPHSRVGCVKCHIGSGADWFVKAKISGSYQVYSVLFNKYPRPIPTPIENLRPAQETCEQCHWPKHFLNEKRVDYTYYLSDEKNTKSSISLLLKIGGGNSEIGTTTGIHWHMNIANEVTYTSIDNSRQVIAVVKSKSLLTGKETVYKNSSLNFVSYLFNEENSRKLDCIDCHNRPSHIYNKPEKMVNLFMSMGRIDETLPYIKSISVKSLEGNYSTKESALKQIKEDIEEFYSLNYPEIFKSKYQSIQKSFTAVQKIYSRNYFPEMKVSWKQFPQNIGHTANYGCFRCHDGKHISDDGKKISNDCNICHIIIAQQLSPSIKNVSLEGLKFIHPAEVGTSVEGQNCVDCHLKRRN